MVLVKLLSSTEGSTTISKDLLQKFAQDTQLEMSMIESGFTVFNNMATKRQGLMNNRGTPLLIDPSQGGGNNFLVPFNNSSLNRGGLGGFTGSNVTIGSVDYSTNTTVSGGGPKPVAAAGNAENINYAAKNDIINGSGSMRSYSSFT